jgi:serine/threonine protein kinase
MSPELIAPEQFGLKSSRPTESSDCYALGMVIYETISGHLPFHEDADLAVFAKVLKGKRPLRGAGFTKGLWRMLERCWASQPSDRPSVGDVLRCLEMPSDLSELPSSGADEGTEKDFDDSDSAEDSSIVSSQPF